MSPSGVSRCAIVQAGHITASADNATSSSSAKKTSHTYMLSERRVSGLCRLTVGPASSTPARQLDDIAPTSDISRSFCHGLVLDRQPGSSVIQVTMGEDAGQYRPSYSR